MNKNNFRYDINALRAIAVIAVVIFHFMPNTLTGGFIGVDVFFVISGFLMTSIIFRGLENNTFNIFKFYAARASRIIPALGALIFLLLILGWFFLAPTDYKILGKHAASSISFFSNITYLKESGYFDASSQEKWLLHTWSLSVEWQFYIIYPAVLLLLKRFTTLNTLKKFIIYSFPFFLLFSIYLSIYKPSASYYLLEARVWEMLFGGLAYLYPITIKKSKLNTISNFGILLITASCLFISSENYWPGYMALIPTFGAYLVLISASQQTFISKNFIVQKIGLWSYSIYLWHWPLVVIGYYYNLQRWTVYGIILSIILGALSYKIIESRKFLVPKNIKDIITYKPLLIVLFIALLGISIRHTNGFEWHYSDEIINTSFEKNNENNFNCMIKQEEKIANLTACTIGNRANPRVIIIGDSHADSIISSITAMYDLKKESVLVLIRASCPYVLNAKNNKLDETCYKENFERLKLLEKYKDIPIIIVGRWSAYLYGQSDPKRILNNDNRPPMYFGKNKYMTDKALISEFSKNLKETLCQSYKHTKVFITQPIPEMGRNIPDTMARLQVLGIKNIDLSIASSQYYQKNKSLRQVIADAAIQCNVTVLDPASILCKNNKCIAQYKNRPIYRDGDHLSEYGNKLLTPMFYNALKQ